MSNNYKLHLSSDSERLSIDEVREIHDALDMMAELSGYMKDVAISLDCSYLPATFVRERYKGLTEERVELDIQPRHMAKILKARPDMVATVEYRPEREYKYKVFTYLRPEASEQYPEVKLYCIGSEEEFESVGLNIEIESLQPEQACE